MAPIIFLILLFIVIKLAIRSERKDNEEQNTMHTFNRKRNAKTRKNCNETQNNKIENNSSNDK